MRRTLGQLRLKSNPMARQSSHNQIRIYQCSYSSRSVSVKTQQRQRNSSIPVYTMETCDTTPFRATPVAAVSVSSRRSGARELGDNVIDQVPIVEVAVRAVHRMSHKAAVPHADSEGEPDFAVPDCNYIR